MQRILLATLVLLLVPAGDFASTATPASFSAAQSLLAASSTPGHLYVAGASVVLTAPVAGDFSACGGSIITASPIAGDGLLLAGSISSRAKVAGDLRAIAGNIDIFEPIAGDLVAFGFSVRDSSRVKGSAFIIAANATLTGGASGPVTIYGNNIALAGDFSEDVTLVASSHISLAPGTTINGKLSYEAPEAANIPDSATIMCGVTYTNASYLPDVGTSRALAFVSIGFFLIARIIGALLLAGLLAGLFPKFAEVIIERIFRKRPRGILLTLLLGFGVVVAAPIVIILLLLTFVGIGLALLLLVLYSLLLLLALLYTGILLGGILVRRLTRRETVVWHDGVLGMLTLSLIAFVPFVGLPVVLLLSLFSTGILLQSFYRFAFPHEDNAE